jgi:hypothetical protein
MEVQDLTSLTMDDFRALAPPFEAAFHLNKGPLAPRRKAAPRPAGHDLPELFVSLRNPR